MEDAVDGVTKSFGMSVCEGSSKINVTEKAHHLLLNTNVSNIMLEVIS
jgi:hypothetical protein